MNNFISSETKEVFSIFNRIKNRDFKGNSGMAIKNSAYQLAYTFVSKAGSLLFTIILARILMPELFGLYSLALVTILVFSFFSDLGAGSTLVKFISSEISKNRLSKAKAYALYLLKIKLLITGGVLIVFLLLAKPLEIYYHKPIFLILLSGSLYLFSISLASFFQGFFQSLNDFKTPFLREALFQGIRLLAVPALAFYLVSKSISGENVLVAVLVSLGILWAVMALFLVSFARKTSLFASKKVELKSKEKKEANLFLKSLLAFSVFSLILTYSDVFVLGGFVSAEYIGYYQAAMGLIGALSTLVLFSNSLLPVFSRMKEGALEIGFNKALKLTAIISFALFILVFPLSGIIIPLLYGEAYAPAIPFFQGLCLLLLLWPFTAMYNGYFIAKGKPEVIKNLLIFTTCFNLALTFTLVYYFSQQSPSAAVLGLIFGTAFSNLVYLMGCAWRRRVSLNT